MLCLDNNLGGRLDILFPYRRNPGLCSNSRPTFARETACVSLAYSMLWLPCTASTVLTRCEALYDRLMELDDVDAVYTNAEGLTH